MLRNHCRLLRKTFQQASLTGSKSSIVRRFGIPPKESYPKMFGDDPAIPLIRLSLSRSPDHLSDVVPKHQILHAHQLLLDLLRGPLSAHDGPVRFRERKVSHLLAGVHWLDSAADLLRSLHRSEESVKQHRKVRSTIWPIRPS